MADPRVRASAAETGSTEPSALDAAPRPIAAPERKTRGPVRKALRRLRRDERWSALEVRVLGVLTWMVLVLLRRTTRLRLVGMEPLRGRWARGEPSVLAFWHGRSIMLPFLYSGPGASIMNSMHRDGEIITRALARFGIRSTRGSSSRSAIAGTLGLVRELRGGRDVALIPDGPRGPAGAAKAGAVSLAAAARVPLFPLAFSARPSIRLGGWDRMMIPLPGAAVVCVVGEPLVFDEARSERAMRDDARRLLEERLREVTRHADRLAGRSEEDL